MISEKTTDEGWQEKRGWDFRRRSDWSIDDKDLAGSEQLSSLGICLATDTFVSRFSLTERCVMWYT